MNAIDGVMRDLLQELNTDVRNMIEAHRNGLGESYLAEDIVTIKAGVTATEALTRPFPV